MQRQWLYKVALWVLGFPLHIIFFVLQIVNYLKNRAQPAVERLSQTEKEAIKQQLLEEERNKQRYFDQNINKEKTEKIVDQRLNNYIQALIIEDEDISESVAFSDICSKCFMTLIS